MNNHIDELHGKSKQNVTFVTAFMNIYDKPLNNVRDIAWRFDHFSKIAETGIPICVYVDSKTEDFMRQFIEIFPDKNVQIMRVLDITETWIHQECLRMQRIEMPVHRTVSKDTYEYMVLMHSKIEFLADAIKQNPWSTAHFAWIDFNIWHIVKDPQRTVANLKMMAASRPSPDRDFLAIPGCWQEFAKDEALVNDAILNRIHWRFCGGFFLGHQASILRLWDLYQMYWSQFLRKYDGHMVWEVNFWSWLETFCNWKPQWFSADHDDRMLQVPIEYLSACLQRDVSGTRVVVYPYKNIPQYYPMSASFTTIHDENGQPVRILNTRYVNYRLTEYGGYLFNDPNHVIRTKNVFSVLDQNWMPVNYQEMADPDSTDLPSKPIPQCPFDGIEDMRIFPGSSPDQLQFLGTSINYSNAESNRMIYGTYDLKEYRLRDCYVLDSLYHWCEKNWCAIVEGTPAMEDQLYIYKWSPLEIGKMVDLGEKRRRLEIVMKHSTSHAPIFERFRGSSSFVDSIHFPGCLIGVVHFSIHEWPRNYYHSLVLLDKATKKPRAYTSIFSFCEFRSIEFCIGFSETVDRKYLFWISRFDRDATMIEAQMDEFIWIPV